MTCVHLRKLYELCQTHELRLGGADLIHIVCHECGEKDVCPSGLMEELPEEKDSEGESTGEKRIGEAFGQQNSA